MKTAFDMDNPFFTLMGRLADYVILNLLFLLTACPVVTVGTALCAMHEVLFKMAGGTEGSLYRSYMQSFIRKFRRTLPAWLILLVTGAVLVFDVTIAADALGTLQKVVLPVAGGLLVLWMLVFSWIFLPPKAGEDEISSRKQAAASGGRAGRETNRGREGRRVKDQFGAALMEAVTHLPQSLAMILLEVFPVLCYLFRPRFFLGILLPFYVCIGFSLSAALCSLLAGRIKIRAIHSKSEE